MTFGAVPGAGEGTIAPQGGCPTNFFTARKWTFEENSLMLRDHNSQPLGRFTFSSPTRFDGQGATGLALTLSR